MKGGGSSTKPSASRGAGPSKTRWADGPMDRALRRLLGIRNGGGLIAEKYDWAAQRQLGNRAASVAIRANESESGEVRASCHWKVRLLSSVFAQAKQQDQPPPDTRRQRRQMAPMPMA